MNIYEVLKPFPGARGGFALFCIIGDEIYFLPHFLKHYRSLGVTEFHFLVDRSTDGSLEFLLEQPDCAVITSRYKFKDRLRLRIAGETIERRFADISRFLVPRDFFMGRWGLVVDADEFLILPKEFSGLDSFVNHLDRHGLNSCRAVMVDFYPAKLADLDRHDRSENPFRIAPYYDLVPIDWPDLALRPVKLHHEVSVRSRINARLIECHPQLSDHLKDGAPVMLHKVPLLRWDKGTIILDAHTANHTPSNLVQVALAHFKFFPGWERKVTGALQEKQYARNSVKYRPLAYARQLLSDWPLCNDATQQISLNDRTIHRQLAFDLLA
ncbi:MAG: hypothetical protein RIS35_3610 [Pseudomonadota bacterium]|jgi:hypothetical protein